jgi:hypothetical protein
MKSFSRWCVLAGLTVMWVVFANFPVFADTYHSADFSGGIFGGSANCLPPFDTIISQSGPVSGSLVYDDQLIPGSGSGSVNVFFSSFPDSANIPAATAFTINLGAPAVTFTLADAVSGTGAIQYNNGHFNGFFFLADFTFDGNQYELNVQGGLWNIQQLVNGVPTLNKLVSGYISIGDASLTNVQPFTPVPLPSTILLFGSSLAGLVGFRKLFKKN